MSEWEMVRGGAESGRWVDGKRLKERPDVAGQLTVRLVGENAAQLLDGDPALRRGFLDWNLFHVEQRYAAKLAEYRALLLQRNSWLRQGARGRPVWDPQLLDCAYRLDQLRREGLDAIALEFSRLAEPFDLLSNTAPEYLPGLPPNSTLESALRADLRAIPPAPYTRYGPHRADFFLACGDGRPVALSRGQTKLAVCLLQLACDTIERRETMRRPVWLVDDLLSNLDPETADRLVPLLTVDARQTIFTVIGPDPAPIARRLADPPMLYSASRGQLTRLS